MVDTASIAIRPAVRGDARALARLHAASFETGWDELSFTGYQDDPCCLALVAHAPGADGAILGFVIARSAGVEADVLRLSVAREARFRGIGRALIAAMCAGLAENGVQTLFLEVGEQNHAASALYRAMGFKRAGAREGYYRDARGNPREAANILRLELRQS